MNNLLNDVYISAVKLLRTTSLEETYEIAIEEAVRLAEATYGTLYLISNRELHKVFSTIPAHKEITPRRRGTTYQAYRLRKIYIVSDKQVKKVHPEVNDKSLKSTIFIPLTFDNKAIGVIKLRSQNDVEYTLDKFPLLKLYSSLTTLKIQNAQLFEETVLALKTRDLFISMASHEFKTPLTAIYAYSQLFHSKLLQNELPKSDWSAALLKETKRLITMVDELLQVNQIKTGKLKFSKQKVKIRDVIKRAQIDFKVTNPSSTLKFIDKNPNSQDIISGDFNKLLQVLINLVNNGVKFSPPKSTVTITLEIKSKKILLNVKDRGIGIKKEEVSKVFDEFYKGNHEKKEGIGLGLFITKNIVDAHDGKIELKSTLGKGTTFTIMLPRSKNEKRSSNKARAIAS